jgi:hypothetical protein
VPDAYPRVRFDEYIGRFNLEDDTAFDEFLHPGMHMKNGTLEYTGIDGMKHHYRDNIWGRFRETLVVKRYVSDAESIAIQMYTRFQALHDDDATIFGPVRLGEIFEFDGVIMYQLESGLFRDILVAYNSFVFTNGAGEKRDLGIPH